MDNLTFSVAAAIITVCLAALALGLTMNRTISERLASRRLRAQNRRLRRRVAGQ